MKNSTKILLHKNKRLKKIGTLPQYLKVQEKKTGLGSESGITSETDSHRHVFFVDSNGNGWAKHSADEETEPDKVPVSHSHKIVNWTVQPSSDEKRNKHLHHLPFDLIQRRIITLSDSRITKQKCLESHSTGDDYAWLNHLHGGVKYIEYEAPVGSGNWKPYKNSDWEMHCSDIDHNTNLKQNHVDAFINPSTRFARLLFHFNDGTMNPAKEEYYELEENWHKSKSRRIKMRNEKAHTTKLFQNRKFLKCPDEFVTTDKFGIKFCTKPVKPGENNGN